MKQFNDFTNFTLSNQTKSTYNTNKYNVPLFAIIVLIFKKDIFKVQIINF